MNKRIYIGLLLVIIGVIIGVVTATQFKDNKPQYDTKETLTDPIIFGYIGPLTGDAAVYGNDEKNVIELALRKINNNGGVLGRKLEIQYEDGQCDGKEAAIAAQQLINIENVPVILGGFCSGETLAIAPITESQNRILFSSASSHPDISNAGDYVFRNAPVDTTFGNALAQLPLQDNMDSIAIISADTTYARGIYEVITSKYKEEGITLKASEWYKQESRDFRTQLSKIKATNPNAIIINAQNNAPGALIAKQVRELGYTGKLYGGFTFSSKEAMDLGGSALNGLIFADAPGLNNNNPQAKQFLSDMGSYYEPPTNEWLAAARYDSVFLVSDAIESCGRVDTTCIRDYLYNLTNYEGVIGTYHFDKNGDTAGLDSFSIKQIVDAEQGKVIELK